MRTATGQHLEPAEPYAASHVTRLQARLGARRRFDGFAVWRAYALVRALWRRCRRVR